MEGSIKLKVTAPPVDNKANIECIKYLSGVFNVPKSNISIVTGQTGRRKKVFIKDLTAKRAQQIIEEHLV